MNAQEIYCQFQIIFVKLMPEQRRLLRFLLQLGDSDGIFTAPEAEALYRRYTHLCVEAEAEARDKAEAKAEAEAAQARPADSDYGEEMP